MERRQIGVVHDLFRYPVKSMQGERLHAVDIGVLGIVGDRAYALRDLNGRFATSKKWPTPLEFSARYDAPPVSGTLAPRGLPCRTARPRRHKQRCLRDTVCDAESTNSATRRSILPPSLAMYPLRMCCQDAPLDPRRLRPNIVANTAPGNEGFLEDGGLTTPSKWVNRSSLCKCGPRYAAS